MSDPYAILGLSAGCGEADVRRRYLELVRQHPPDRAPERFAEVHDAYEKLRDPVLRMESALFDLDSLGTVVETIADVRRRLRTSRIPTQTLLSLAEAAMNDWPDGEAMIERFRQWLGEVRREAESLPPDAAAEGEPHESRPVGLLELVEEFTALRHEVKLQTKSSRGVAERTEQALAAIQQAVELFRGVEAKEAEAGRLAAKPLVESLMELDEALGRGRAVIDAARRRILEDLAARVREELDNLLLRLPWWRRWLCGRWNRQANEILVLRTAVIHREIFDSLVEGYGLILTRLERAMKKAELYRIQCVGKMADPNLMTVVEVVDDPLRPPGLVIEEVRPGYCWKDKVLRFAEVRAVQGRTDH